MARITVSESDFIALSLAAFEAHKRGDKEESAALDKLARRMNAALSKGIEVKALGAAKNAIAPDWRRMPSTLSGNGLSDAIAREERLIIHELASHLGESGY